MEGSKRKRVLVVRRNKSTRMGNPGIQCALTTSPRRVQQLDVNLSPSSRIDILGATNRWTEYHRRRQYHHLGRRRQAGDMGRVQMPESLTLTEPCLKMREDENGKENFPIRLSNRWRSPQCNGYHGCSTFRNLIRPKFLKFHLSGSRFFFEKEQNPQSDNAIRQWHRKEPMESPIRSFSSSLKLW